MIKSLQLTNVGPAPDMQMEFASRLNFITGDNGLGKSFLLDIVWWALTRKWPAEINARLTSGKKAIPSGQGEAKISFSFPAKSKIESYESIFSRKEQSWTGRSGRPANPGLILYAMSDGSFAVWDPHRNYWRPTPEGVDVQDRVPAYVFGPAEVWDGLSGPGNSWLCNGLIRDWASWQKENGTSFQHIKDVLKVLSPSSTNVIEPGELTRISLDDVRDMPTVKMAYGQDIAVIHASSGMRRIMALAYFLVWTWEEHKQAAKQLGEPESRQITFLIDEIESHLHPAWQRTIVPALLSVVEKLTTEAEVQLITATHSPLIMASVEPYFDSEKDAWFDLDLEEKEVILRSRGFEKQGDATSWLVSDAFDLKSGRSLEYEKLIEDAAELLVNPAATKNQFKDMNNKLIEALSPKDEFLFNWRYICKQKGLLE